jgi:hypothetical protein
MTAGLEKPVKDYLMMGAGLLGAWILFSRPMSKEEAAHNQWARLSKGLMSLAVAGGCVWFAWWVLATRCAGGC